MLAVLLHFPLHSCCNIKLLRPALTSPTLYYIKNRVPVGTSVGSIQHFRFPEICRSGPVPRFQKSVPNALWDRTRDPISNTDRFCNVSPVGSVKGSNPTSTRPGSITTKILPEARHLITKFFNVNIFKATTTKNNMLSYLK